MNYMNTDLMLDLETKNVQLHFSHNWNHSGIYETMILYSLDVGRKTVYFIFQ